jgi:hypothetical protein
MAKMRWGYLLILFFSPLLVFFFHLFLARLLAAFKVKVSPLYPAALIVLLGIFVCGVMSWNYFESDLISLSERLILTLYGVTVYTGLSFSYFQFFAMTETARRIYILRELYSGTLSQEQIQNHYGEGEILSVRLERLVVWNQLKRSGNRYFIKQKFLLWVAKIMDGWARVLGFQKRGE